MDGSRKRGSAQDEKKARAARGNRHQQGTFNHNPQQKTSWDVAEGSTTPVPHGSSHDTTGPHRPVDRPPHSHDGQADQRRKQRPDTQQNATTPRQWLLLRHKRPRARRKRKRKRPNATGRNLPPRHPIQEQAPASVKAHYGGRRAPAVSTMRLPGPPQPPSRQQRHYPPPGTLPGAHRHGGTSAAAAAAVAAVPLPPRLPAPTTRSTQAPSPRPA